MVDRDYEQTGRIFTYVRLHFAAPSPTAIEVSQSLAGHAAVRAEVLRSAGATALVIAVASGFVTFLLGLVLVGRPLAELVAQARRVGEGDLSYRIATRRRDEVAELGREMNRMCERLRDARESERVQADAKMRALSQLRHADRLATVGRLAAGLAHELGTPLNVVQARARQMASGTLGSKEVAEKSSIIVEQVARMTKLIRQLLDFARKGELQPTEVDVRALVDRAVTLLEPIARKRGVSLAVAGGAEPLQGHIDPEQMTQVVLNLVMNAVHATESGKAVYDRPGPRPRRASRRGRPRRAAVLAHRGTRCRQRHRSGRASAHLRTILHHQGRGRGDRLGSVGGVRHREGPRGLDRRRQSSRRGKHLHGVASRRGAIVTRVLVVDDEKAMADAMAEELAARRLEVTVRVERRRGIRHGDRR